MKKSRLNFLFVSIEGLIGDLAWKISEEGHNVKYYIKERFEKNVCDGFVQKVDGWRDYINWADVIIFDDIGNGNLPQTLRKKGKLVIGGTSYTDRLEIEREFGQKELAEVGVRTLPQYNFKDFDEAAAFVRKNPDRYVIKPSGRALSDGKELLFVGQEEDGRDIVQVLKHYKKNWSRKIKSFQIQKYASGVEIAVGAFFNGKEFIYPININFEHKKLFNGEIGPSTGEMGTLMYWSAPNRIFEETLQRMGKKLAKSGYVGYADINCIANGKGIFPLEFTCFSEDTEILTENGWKFIKDVKRQEKVATLNPKSHNLEYQNVTGFISKKYTGELIHISGAGQAHEALDCLVTPDHRMYIQKRNSKFDFVNADAIPQGSKIKRTAKWKGKKIKTYSISEYTENHYLGRQKKIHLIKHTEIKTPMDVWLKFLGIYLAEGSIGGRRHIVNISQFNHKEEMRKLLKDFPLKVVENKKGFQISSTQLVRHLESYNFGKSGTKYVPDHVKSLPPEQIKIFLDAFRVGDGTIHKRTGQSTYFSTSKKMIDDIQELLLKCGIVGNVRAVKSKGTKSIGGYTRNSDIYFIAERVKKIDYYVDKRNITKVPYKGKVYCVEVPNHIIYVRRNGKAFWCGNCRFGYPTISIMMEGVVSEWGELMYRLAKGDKFNIKVKRGFQVGIVIAVPPFPFWDTEAFTRYSEDAVILFKNGDRRGIHLGEVKLEDGDWKLAGKSGYALIITGSGPTVEAARKQAYSRVANIMIPNMFYRTDIGLRWHEDSDKLQTSGYLY